MREIAEARDEAPTEERERPHAAAQASRVGYAPIVRVDRERREIELCATSEALDAHGTIFDYDASKDAFTRWIGNVREMHERRAVGRRVEVRCDDAARKVYVRVRISRGAQDTWEKVLDGTLRGASVGASDVVWRRERRTVGGRTRAINVAARYDLAELSLVDNPSNPDALGVTFVRGAEPDATLLDPLETRASAEGDAQPAQAQPLHDAARTLLAGCGCLLCETALAALADPDAADEAKAENGVHERQARAVSRAVVASLRASAGGLARLETALRETRDAVRELRTARDRSGELANETATSVPDVEITALRARVERLEAQPAPGGPAIRAVEKSLAQGAPFAGSGASPAGQTDALAALESLAGRLRDPQAQLAVAAELIRLQRESR